MTDSDVDELGPVDYIVVEFEADRADPDSGDRLGAPGG
jgi:hypothetical protein